MQRKIDQYWKRKDNIKETVSAVAGKVQRTVTLAPKLVQSVITNQRNKNKLIPFYFRKLAQLFIH